MAGPVEGRSRRATVFRAVLPCLALIALTGTPAQAQTVTPDLFSPTRSSQLMPVDSPLRRTSAEANDKTSDEANDARVRDKEKPAPSRIGAIPRYGLPAASGASSSGYDSLNRKLQKPKYYPGQVRPKPPPGPGSRPPLLSNTPLRLSIPPSQTANKAPIPPAMAGTVVGQPARKRLKIDDDPFGAVGDYAGSFLIKSALELSGGYNTNPRRTVDEKGSPFYVIAPELLVMSDWERHAVVADLRGSFTGYGNTFPPPADGTVSPAPVVVDRPDFTGHVDGRLDVSRDTRLLAQARLRLATDNPGSPNIQAGLQRYPVYATFGGTFGFDQNFNRLQVSGGATVDRTAYTYSKLTDGTSTSNDDRNFNQFGGVGRVSYDLMPGLKPFVEAQADSRVHDLRLDRSGFARDSTGGYVKGGTSFEFSRLLTGEIAVGYAARDYVDSRLNRLEGLLTSASLTWTATPLTTAKFYSDTTITETTLPGVSGVLTHIYTVEVDHDFRRWLTAIGKFTWGTLDYQGDNRKDKIYTVSGDLIYKMTRNLWVKGTVRRDWLDSNLPGNSTAATIVMLGVRLQH
ncbi:outer membrane beta-barrel protein [Bradyrhizobium sp. JYMT SZCCT0180]|uniref:outer membrane beta-barrel protein n=1 Tax=Bradyrhizobium sp. JYMT SZCCT0180 TaxID=2807666 RepID=UPI001BAB417C|nr:outer membrane beta-barrel protein [Bradyrhizobium sp. JYMT SZCCT0180]MBR1209190.1 outer membrane beta-barrel protein [Bradyrhizobium sp. JYMT SZCCT0180]